jgi:sugar phosphate isomerase/epimerase
LAVSSLAWAGGFTGSEGRTYRESLLDAVEAIETTASLGAACLVVHSGPRHGHTHNHAKRIFTDALHELIPFAAEHGVTLVVEPMHPACAAEWTFLTSLDETLDLLAKLGSPQVKFVFDTYHLGHDRKSLERIAEAANQIALVHLADAHRPPDGDQNRQRLGHGRLPLGETLSALAEAGYDGYYEVELFGEEIEAADYAELLGLTQRTFEELCDTVAR